MAVRCAALGDKFIFKDTEIIYIGTVAGGMYVFYTNYAEDLDCDGILKLKEFPEEKVFEKPKEHDEQCKHHVCTCQPTC